MLQRIQRIRCTKPTFEERRMIMTMKDYIQICKIIYKYKKYIQKSTLEERRMHRRHLLMFSHRNSARLCGKNQRISLGNISIIVIKEISLVVFLHLLRTLPATKWTFEKFLSSFHSLVRYYPLCT